MAKVLLLLRGQDSATLGGQLAPRLQEAFGLSPAGTVQMMGELAGDPFYDPSASMPRPQIVLELLVKAGAGLAESYNQLSQVLQDVSLLPGSLALVMHHREYIPAPPVPIHYHQLMFRRRGLNAADYMDYYTRFHCRMGFNTPGIAGYTQNYIDAEASAALAERLDLTTVAADSISELTMDSVDALISDPQLAEVGGAAGRDEERFVDRARNVAFCSQVLLRLGDFDAVSEPAFDQHFPAGPVSGM